MKERLKTYLKEYEKGIFDTAEELRNQTLPKLSEELFAIFEKNGNRSIYENVYFQSRRALAVYGMAVAIRHRREDVLKLEEVITHICDEECWALPAHVNRAEDAEWRVYVDLFAAETGGVLADYITRFESELSQAVCTRARQEVTRRILEPYCGSTPPYSMWEGNHTNWCAVCSGNIGCAALCLLRDNPARLQTVLDRVCHSLEGYIAGFSDDGASLEGAGYYNYGMIYYTEFAEQLYRYTDGRKDLMQGDKLRKIAGFMHKYYLNNGSCISFSDGSRTGSFPLGLACYLVMRYSEDAKIPYLDLADKLGSDNCYRTKTVFQNYFITKRFIKWLDTPEGKGYHNRGISHGQDTSTGAQWSICQNEAGAALVCKGGYNDEPHNHNDVGHLIYTVGKDSFLPDLGAGEYTREYFSAETRYQILCNSSLGHSVPVINGLGQGAGQQYHADVFETDGAGTTVIKFQSAYEAGTIEALERVLTFEEETGNFTMVDTFVPSPVTNSIQECLITLIEPCIEGNLILLTGQEYSCRLMVEGNIGQIKVVKDAHITRDERMKEVVYRILWDVYMRENDNGREIYQSSIHARTLKH